MMGSLTGDVWEMGVVKGAKGGRVLLLALLLRISGVMGEGCTGCRGQYGS